MADWYYIGHYGQLGPLTLEQMDELIQGGVIAQDTYVWRTGMPDWVHAGTVPELGKAFTVGAPFASPPPPPMPSGPPPNPSASVSSPGPSLPYGTAANYGTSPSYAYPTPYTSNFPALKSDRSRVLAGILQIILPCGVGRIYLGYAAYGVLQFVLVFCFGIGALWAFIDGILILAGTPKLGGYGRVLNE